MVFSSSLFLLYFLPVFLLVYHLVPRVLKNTVILLASIVFYAWGAPKFLFVVMGVTLLDFYLVKLLHEAKSERIRKIFLVSSVSLNLGLLAYFKYANFFIENVNEVLSGLGFHAIAWTKVALPVGISFFVFQSLTYGVDVYRRVHKPLKSVLDYMLFILSFPQLIAGPIVRFGTVAGQIAYRHERIDDKLAGFYRFCIGLAKKVLIANVMAEQAHWVFDGDLHTLNASYAWIGLLAYTFQIYFDFSGYSDMAIGLGRIMGFHFPENFNSPYTSRSITEFWRRWHITLGVFFRDYVYIPLGGNKVASETRLYFNLGLVFLLSGLWHGASWNFVLWGAYHGLILILDRLFLLNILNKVWKPLSMLFTFLLVMFGWVIFKIENVDQIGLFFKKLVDFNTVMPLKTITAFWPVLFIAIFFSFVMAIKRFKPLEDFFFFKDQYSSIQHVLLLLVSSVLFVVSLSSITSSGFNPFIYFRF